MKIYILPVHHDFQPPTQPFLYPKYNEDYGVEQDFLTYLRLNPDLVTLNSDDATWHYLPVFWTRYHLNRNHRPEGIASLAREIERVVDDDSKTLTVCQFDDGPLVDLGQTLQFQSSRKNAATSGIDIPLLASPIPQHLFHSRPIQYLASFTGQFKNHVVRSELNSILADRDDIYIKDGDFGIEFFVEKSLESEIILCPRGYGGSSFRLYEAMQLGRIPLIIGDVDPRPFKRFFDWDEISFFTKYASDVPSILDHLCKLDLQRMGEKSRKVWEQLNYQNWCLYVIEELRIISSFSSFK